MSLPATDDFAGTGALSGSWTVMGGTPSRSSGVLIGATAALNIAFWNADVFAADQYSQGLIVTDLSGPAVRCSGTGGGGQGYAFISSAGIYKLIGSAPSVELKAYTTSVVGKVAKLVIAGSLLSLYVDGSFVDSVSDGSYASGSAGASGYLTAGSLDTWQADNGTGIVTSGTPFFTQLEVKRI